MALSEMIRFPWERKVWMFMGIVEVYLLVELEVFLLE